MRYCGTIVTDAGTKKQINQDSALLKIGRTNKDEEIAMLIVCDGIGGLSMGEAASSEVIRAFDRWFERRLPEVYSQSTPRMLADEWRQILVRLNREMLRYAGYRHIRMGTTFTGILCRKDVYMLMHIGDTRIYEITDHVHQITEDHTYATELVRLGKMTQHEAVGDPYRHVLTRCVGAVEQIQPQIVFGEVMTDSVYMLCSDGFRHVLSEEEIYRALNARISDTAYHMEQHCRYLVDLVKQRGETDNITVALLKVTE